MKTDELIDVLSTNVERVDTGKVSRNLQLAIVGGLILALITGLAVLGVRCDLRNPSAFGFLVLKVGFGVAVILLGSHYLLKHARPGGEMRSWIFVTTIPFVAVMALAGVSLISAPASHWDHMLMGDRWIECLHSRYRSGTFCSDHVGRSNGGPHEPGKNGSSRRLGRWRDQRSSIRASLYR